MGLPEFSSARQWDASQSSTLERGYPIRNFFRKQINVWTIHGEASDSTVPNFRYFDLQPERTMFLANPRPYEDGS